MGPDFLEHWFPQLLAWGVVVACFVGVAVVARL
jgi:hypothetical protein